MDISAVKVESGAEEGKPAPESVPFAPRAGWWDGETKNTIKAFIKSPPLRLFTYLTFL